MMIFILQLLFLISGMSTDRAAIGLSDPVEGRMVMFEETDEADAPNSPQSVSTYNCKKTGRKTRILSWEGDMIRVTARKQASRCWITSIEFNLASIYRGYNGWLLSETEWWEAMSELAALIRPLLRYPDDWVKVIPGLTPHSPSYWQSIEIPFQCYDPHGLIHAAYQNCRHRRIQKVTLPGKGGTRKLPGTNLTAKFYSKTAELKNLCKKFDADPQPPIQRIEFTLKKDILVEYFRLVQNDHPAVVFREGKLRSFSLSALAAVHRIIASELEGFHPGVAGASGVEATAHARYIADLVIGGANADEEIARWFRINPPKNPSDRNSRSRLRKQVYALIGAASPIDFDKVFSKENYLNQPGISIPKLEAYRRSQWVREGIEPLIREAYRDLPSADSSGGFTPPRNS